MRRVFAEAVPRRERGLNAALRQHACSGDRDREDSRLRMLRELELLFRALEDQLGEREPKGFVRLVKDSAGNREVVVKIASHADGLRSLAGKKKS